MKIPGIIRKVDTLGRVVIPQSLRSSMGIKCGDLVEMFQEGDRLVMQKFACSCVFCGANQHLIVFMDKPVCKDCVSKLKE